MGVANCSMNGADEAKIKRMKISLMLKNKYLPMKVIRYTVWSKNHSGLANVVPTEVEFYF